MAVAGLDLAAKNVNPSGFAIIDKSKLTRLELLRSDNEIKSELRSFNFSVIAIDAPLTDAVGRTRTCDKLMKK
ncbi:MAG: hypothetical protein JSV49_11320, partial [Thermoplasmata archaeon]